MCNCQCAKTFHEAVFGLDARAVGSTRLLAFLLEGIGTLVHFQDPEGNVVGAMQYLPGVLTS